MDPQTVPDAWVTLATEEQMRARIPADVPRHPYDFGFLAPMSRLTQAHPAIGPKFSALFAQIMFAPGALTRQEREMIAGAVLSMSNAASIASSAALMRILLRLIIAIRLSLHPTTARHIA